MKIIIVVVFAIFGFCLADHQFGQPSNGRDRMRQSSLHKMIKPTLLTRFLPLSLGPRVDVSHDFYPKNKGQRVPSGLANNVGNLMNLPSNLEMKAFDVERDLQGNSIDFPKLRNDGSYDENAKEIRFSAQRPSSFLEKDKAFVVLVEKVDDAEEMFLRKSNLLDQKNNFEANPETKVFPNFMKPNFESFSSHNIQPVAQFSKNSAESSDDFEKESRKQFLGFVRLLASQPGGLRNAMPPSEMRQSRVEDGANAEDSKHHIMLIHDNDFEHRSQPGGFGIFGNQDNVPNKPKLPHPFSSGVFSSISMIPFNDDPPNEDTSKTRSNEDYARKSVDDFVSKIIFNKLNNNQEDYVKKPYFAPKKIELHSDNETPREFINNADKRGDETSGVDKLDDHLIIIQRVPDEENPFFAVPKAKPQFWGDANESENGRGNMEEVSVEDAGKENELAALNKNYIKAQEAVDNLMDGVIMMKDLIGALKPVSSQARRSNVVRREPCNMFVRWEDNGENEDSKMNNRLLVLNDVESELENQSEGDERQTDQGVERINEALGPRNIIFTPLVGDNTEDNLENNSNYEKFVGLEGQNSGENHLILNFIQHDKNVGNKDTENNVANQESGTNSYEKGEKHLNLNFIAPVRKSGQLFEGNSPRNDDTFNDYSAKTRNGTVSDKDSVKEIEIMLEFGDESTNINETNIDADVVSDNDKPEEQPQGPMQVVKNQNYPEARATPNPLRDLLANGAQFFISHESRPALINKQSSALRPPQFMNDPPDMTWEAEKLDQSRPIEIVELPNVDSNASSSEDSEEIFGNPGQLPIFINLGQFVEGESEKTENEDQENGGEVEGKVNGGNETPPAHVEGTLIQLGGPEPKLKNVLFPFSKTFTFKIQH